MRLLLDELYPKAIAVVLRDRGHDVITVRELDHHLGGEPDTAILAAAVRDRRALVTENADDLIRIHREYVADRRPHYGLILTSNRSLPRHRADAFIRAAVRALDDLLEARPGDDDTSPLLWIP